MPKFEIELQYVTTLIPEAELISVLPRKKKKALKKKVTKKLLEVAMEVAQEIINQ